MTMHTREDDSIWGEYERLVEENNRLLALNKVLEKKVEAIERRLNTEMKTSARFSQQLWLRNKKNNQLLIENAELEKRIEELE